MGKVVSNLAAGVWEDLVSGDRPWVAIAANPYSGHGPTQKRVSELAAALTEAGLEPCVIWDRTERANALRHAELAKNCRCVVAAGGDGTVADVINELTSPVPLATLPSGNENLFAREFGFKRNGKLLADAIAAGRVRQVDLARAAGRLFSLMLTAGLDAEVVRRVTAWRTNGPALRRVNRLSYAKPIVAALRGYQYGRLELDADNERAAGTHAFVFNLPQYGFQLPFAPHAKGDDGWLDWLVFDYPGFGGALGHFVSLLRTKHLDRSGVLHGRARRVRITAAEPVPVQMDGEAAGLTPVEVEVVPGALCVLIP